MRRPMGAPSRARVASVLRQRQQIIEIGALVSRPRQMFRDQCRLIAFNERAKTFEMGNVEWLWAAERHTNSVQRDGIVASNAFEGVVRSPPRAHLVFGVHFEKAAQTVLGEDRGQMLMLQTRPC